MREADLVLAVERWLRAQGFETNIEVPFLRRRVRQRSVSYWDIVAWSADRVLAIEVKSKLTELAIDQAAAMAVACREVYVAAPPSKAMEWLWPEAAERYGIGLIVVDGDRCHMRYSAGQVLAGFSLEAEGQMLKLARLLPREGVVPGDRRAGMPKSYWQHVLSQWDGPPRGLPRTFLRARMP